MTNGPRNGRNFEEVFEASGKLALWLSYTQRLQTWLVRSEATLNNFFIGFFN